MLTIGDTMTVFAVHGVVSTETAAHDQRVQSVHRYQIAEFLSTYNRPTRGWSRSNLLANATARPATD